MKLKSILMNHMEDKKYHYDHKKATKPIEAEELMDYYVNRRLAAPIVRLTLNTPIRPNHISLMSMIVGVAAGMMLYHGYLPWVCGLMLYLAVILDCADGQLARARGAGSLSGRILDGFVDYVNGVVYFVGMTFYPLFTDTATALGWGIAASISMIIHSMVVDYYKTKYITAISPNEKNNNLFISDIIPELKKAWKQAHILDILVLGLYYLYLAVQSLFIDKRERTESKDQISLQYAQTYTANNRKIIQYWGLIGPGWHFILMIAASIAALFLPSAFVVMYIIYATVLNVFMGVLFIWQMVVNRNVRREMTE